MLQDLDLWQLVINTGRDRDLERDLVELREAVGLEDREPSVDPTGVGS